MKLGVKGWLVDSVQRLVFNLNVSNRLQPTGGGRGLVSWFGAKGGFEGRGWLYKFEFNSEYWLLTRTSLPLTGVVEGYMICFGAECEIGVEGWLVDSVQKLVF